MGTSKEIKRLALKMHKRRLGYASPKLYNGRFFIFYHKSFACLSGQLCVSVLLCSNSCITSSHSLDSFILLYSAQPDHVIKAEATMSSREASVFWRTME